MRQNADDPFGVMKHPEYQTELKKLAVDIGLLIGEDVFNFFVDKGVVKFFGKLLFYKIKCHLAIKLMGNPEMNDVALYDCVDKYLDECKKGICYFVQVWDNNRTKNSIHVAVQKQVVKVIVYLFKKIATRIGSTDEYKFNYFYYNEECIIKCMSSFNDPLFKMLKNLMIYYFCLHP